MNCLFKANKRWLNQDFKNVTFLDINTEIEVTLAFVSMKALLCLMPLLQSSPVGFFFSLF